MGFGNSGTNRINTKMRRLSVFTTSTAATHRLVQVCLPLPRRLRIRYATPGAPFLNAILRTHEQSMGASRGPHLSVPVNRSLPLLRTARGLFRRSRRPPCGSRGARAVARCRQSNRPGGLTAPKLTKSACRRMREYHSILDRPVDPNLAFHASREEAARVSWCHTISQFDSGDLSNRVARIRTVPLPKTLRAIPSSRSSALLLQLRNA
jgi:hypothetical protein